MSKKTTTITLPDGTRKVLEGVGAMHEVPRAFWVEVADVLGLQGIRDAVGTRWGDSADTQYGDHELQFVTRNRVTVIRGVQDGPNRTDYTKPGISVEVVQVVDYSV
jgi:hypothetical protein